MGPMASRTIRHGIMRQDDIAAKLSVMAPDSHVHRIERISIPQSLTGGRAGSIGDPAGQRFNQMIINRMLGNVPLGINEQANCNDYVSAFGSAGSFSADVHGRKNLTASRRRGFEGQLKAEFQSTPTVVMPRFRRGIQYSAMPISSQQWAARRTGSPGQAGRRRAGRVTPRSCFHTPASGSRYRA